MPERRPPLIVVRRGAAPPGELSNALDAAEPRVHLLAAAVLIDAGALEAAWEPLSQAAHTAIGPGLRADVGDQLLRLASEYQARLEHDGARRALKLAASLVPVRAAPALARQAQRERLVEEAIGRWAEAIRLDPKQADHHLQYGRLLEARGRFQDAYDAYLRLVEEVPTVSTALTVAPRLRRLASELEPTTARATRIAMLGSDTLDQLRDCLAVQAHRAGLRPEIHCAAADRYAAEILDPGSELYRFAPELLVLAIDRRRLFPELDDRHWPLSGTVLHQVVRRGVDSVRELLGAFRERSNALVLLHNMVVPEHAAPGASEWQDRTGLREAYQRVNRRLARLASTEFRGVRILDVDGVEERCGKARATDPRLWLAARIPWSERLLVPLAREHLGHLLAHRGMGRPSRALRGQRAGEHTVRRPGADPASPSIESRARAVIAASFDLDEDDLPTPANPETIPAWTPLTQMTVVLNLEERFDVSFSPEQMVAMTSAERITETLTTMLEAGPGRP